MEAIDEDIKKKYPSLPPNYVSLAHLQERWIQQQQQKQKEQEQKEKVALEEEQSKEKKGFNQVGQNSKNGMRRNRAQGLHFRQIGERRVYAQKVYAPVRTSNENHPKNLGAKSELKPEQCDLTGSVDQGGGGARNSMQKKKKKYNNKKRWPRVENKLNGEDPTQTLTGNGGTPGVLIGQDGGYETGNVCMVGLVPEAKGKEVNPEASSRKNLRKQVVNTQGSSSTGSSKFERESRGKQVVNGQFSSNTDDRRVELESRGKESVNGKFLSNTDDRGVEGCLNEYIVEVLPENKSEEEIYNDQSKNSGNHQGLVEEGNLSARAVLQDNVREEKVPGDERRKTGKERFRGRFQGNEGNWRIERSSNDNKVPLEVSQQMVEEGLLAGQKERNGLDARSVKGVQGYGNKDRVPYERGPNFVRYFGDLSLNGSSKGNPSRGQRRSYGAFGRFASGRKGKQADGGLVWVKKEEISGANLAEIS